MMYILKKITMRKILLILFISLIPNQFRAYNIQKIQSEKKFRLISDYISGMTDRFAEKEHKKL